MIRFRTAQTKDLESIAYLHALNWQTHYRGSFKDEYLDGPVFEERLAVWKERFIHPDPGQYIILAEEKDNLVGFICLFLDKDPAFGTLIDNIHVSTEFAGKGIGKTLMTKAGDYIQQHSKMDKYFLWVLKDNTNSIAFYKKVGGKIESTKIFDNPGGGRSEVYRIVWEL